jgi:hypothetical protein
MLITKKCLFKFCGAAAHVALITVGVHALPASAETMPAKGSAQTTVLSSSSIATPASEAPHASTRLNETAFDSINSVLSDRFILDPSFSYTTAASDLAQLNLAPAQPAATLAAEPVAKPVEAESANSAVAPSPVNIGQSEPAAPADTPSLTVPSEPLAPRDAAPSPRETARERILRPAPSYFGLGGAIGAADGDSGLKNGSFAIISKLTLLRNLSFRPGALINENPTVMLPLTLDFVPFRFAAAGPGVRVAPYAGLGIAIDTGHDSGVNLLATGGFDIPLNRRFTANTAINVTLFNNSAVGFQIGIGYNF